MANAITGPADIVNLALKEIGYKLRVGNLTDGSDASNTALDLYSQALDVMLRDGDWSFAQRMVNGVMLKQAPAGGYFDAPWDPAQNPPMPWQFSYELPSDYLKIRDVRPPPGFLVNVDPQPQLQSVVNDNGYTPPRRVLVCNVAQAVIVYTAQVTDPTQWPADFIDAFKASLARRLAPALASLDAVKIAAQDEMVSTERAAVTQG